MPSAHAADSFFKDRLTYSPTTGCVQLFVQNGQRELWLCWGGGVVVLMFVDVVLVVVVVGWCELWRWCFFVYILLVQN